MNPHIRKLELPKILDGLRKCKNKYKDKTKCHNTSIMSLMRTLKYEFGIDENIAFNVIHTLSNIGIIKQKLLGDNRFGFEYDTEIGEDIEWVTESDIRYCVNNSLNIDRYKNQRLMGML